MWMMCFLIKIQLRAEVMWMMCFLIKDTAEG